MFRARIIVACLIPISVFLLSSSLSWFFPIPAALANPGEGSQVELEGRWALGPALAVAAKDDIVECGIGSRLRIVDFSHPGTPILLGGLDLPAPIYDIKSAGRYCYLADSSGGLRIVDCLVPGLPVEVGGLFLPGEAYALDVIFPYAYVAANEGGLRIVDISDPTAPFEIGSYATDCYAMDVKVEGSRAYVTDMYDATLKVFDVSDPHAPSVLGSQSTGGAPWSVDVSGSNAYVVDDDGGLRVFDLSGGDVPQQIALSWMNDLAYQVEVAGDYAFVANDWEGLGIFDLSLLPAMTRVGWHDTPGSCWRIALDGDRVYVADQEGGIRVMNVSDVTNVQEVRSWDPVGFSRRVVVRDRYAYLVSDADGLHIIDTWAVGGAREVGHLLLPGSPWNLDVEGNYAYVACQSLGGCRIVDVSDPAHPFEAGHFFTPDYGLGEGVVSVDAQGDLLYLVDYYYGFYVYNVHDPASPTLVADLGMVSFPKDLEMQGDYAYVSDRTGFRILDCSALPAITQVFWEHHDHTPYDVEVEGNRLYLSEGWWGVDVYDLSGPSTPVYRSHYKTPGTAEQLKSAGDFLYVADGSQLTLLNVVDPLQVQVVGYYDTGSNAMGVDSYGQRIYLADDFDGLFVLKNLLMPPVAVEDGPSIRRILLAQNHPNPFNPSTSIQYYIPSSGPVKLSIYDTAGRRVRGLIEEWQKAGLHAQSWDGKDADGHALPSGVYHYRLEANGQKSTKSMVLLR